VAVQQLNSSKPILCFKVTGTLTRTELAWLQSKAIAAIKDSGKVRTLVILEDFHGWKKGPGWDDLSFANEHDRNIEKMAIVGPEQWRDLACVFAGKGLRSVAVEYFLPSQLEQARKWLSNL
jgi:stage II sporulation SpoAA-like protein